MAATADARFQARRARRRARRRELLRRAIYPVVLVLVAALFLAYVVSSVIGPATFAQSLTQRLHHVRGRYIAEDVFLRALRNHSLASAKQATLAEGELSPFPEQQARVYFRTGSDGARVYCSLQRGSQELVFLGSYARGELAPSLAWAFGQGEEGELDDDVLVRGECGRLSFDPANAQVHPYAIPGAWEIIEDLCVTPELEQPGRVERDINLASFRVASELPLTELSEPTDLPDFELGRRRNTTLVAAFRAKKDLVIRVAGHLWVGDPSEPLLVGTGGRSVVVLVDGNIYVRGSLKLLGPRDSLVLACGKPGWAAFRDANGNGHRDDGEPQIAAPTRSLGPREGAGLIYLGRGTAPVHVHASLIARHDVLVAEPGASVQGALLAGTRLLRLGSRPGRLELNAETRFPGPRLACRGLPLLPGTEAQERVTQIRLLLSRDSEPEPGIE